MAPPKDKTIALRKARIKRVDMEAPAPLRPGFPAVRPRRNRKADWSRRLVRETTLTVDDLIWPIFLVEGRNFRSPIAAMPGVERVSIDLAVRAAAEAAHLGVPAIALFPYTEPSLRDEFASEARRKALEGIHRDIERAVTLALRALAQGETP